MKKFALKIVKFFQNLFKKILNKNISVKTKPAGSYGKKLKLPIESKHSDKLLVSKKMTEEPKKEYLINGRKIKSKHPLKKFKKPYKRKDATEPIKKKVRLGKERDKLLINKKKLIDLGKIRVKKQRKELINVPKKTVLRSRRKKRVNAVLFLAIESPYIELDLDSGGIYFIIPEQKYRLVKGGEKIEKLIYRLQLNEENKDILVGLKYVDGIAIAKRKKIEIKKPLRSFKIFYPKELKNKTFSYEHSDEWVYIFNAIGNNIGTMHYLYEKDGNINPISKKSVWILVHEKFTLNKEPDITEERWIWNNYKPFYLRLRKIDEINLSNVQNNEIIKIPCKVNFTMEGDKLINDDFKESSPLFIGKFIKIKTSRINKDGWSVWIQNKKSGYRLINNNWYGFDAIEVNLPEDLPCEFGEFQVNICNKNDRVPIETLFFRYIPYIEIHSREKLKLPDSKNGYRPENVKVIFGKKMSKLRLKTKDEIEVIENGYNITIPPKNDYLYFSILKKDKPETELRVKVNMPKILFKTSTQNNWNDKVLQIKRDDLQAGIDNNIYIYINNLNKRYILKAVLENEDSELQEMELIRKGVVYSALLNQFYDTIYENKDALRIMVCMLDSIDNKIIHKLQVLSISTPMYRCKLCNYKSYNKKEIKAHLKDNHINEFIKPLTLNEMREYISSLPLAIYKCRYCNFYAKGSDPDNPTSKIISHIEKKHNEHIRFEIIGDIGEIRENVIPDLPNWHKCKICGFNFKERRVDYKIEHLVECHQEEIFTYK